jgi:hypothetical protein
MNVYLYLCIMYAYICEYIYICMGVVGRTAETQYRPSVVEMACLFMYDFMYICIYICLFVCVCIYLYVMYAFIRMYMYVYINVYLYLHIMYIYVHIYTL